jgi:hypothetical protein
VQLLQAALEREAIAESPWLVHQFEGRIPPVVGELLEQGTWRFAIKTTELEDGLGTPSEGYAYSFVRPADWLRTVQLYDDSSGRQLDVDYREEGGYFHAGYSPVVLRYLSTDLGYDPTKWSELFQAALLARLQLRRAVENPATQTGILQVLRANAERTLKEAKAKDAQRDRPLVDTYSRFVQGRFGHGWGRSYREQG